MLKLSASDDGVVEAGVGVDDVNKVVMLMAGEAAVEGEPDLGLLDGVLVLVQHLLPAAQMVGMDTVVCESLLHVPEIVLSGG